MSDQSLRTVVLAELSSGTHTEAFADGARWAVQEAEKLAAAPAPDRQPSDAAVEAAARLLFNAEWREGDRYWEQYPEPNRWQMLARQTLEAAYRVDVPRPALDPEALAAVLHDQHAGHEWGSKGCQRAGSNCAKRYLRDADAVLALLHGSGVDSSLHTCPGCGVKVIGHERCGDPTREGCAS